MDMLLLLVSAALAQEPGDTSASLALILRERGSGLPVAASLQVDGAEQRIEVGPTGRIELDLVPGTHTIVIESDRHQPLTVSEELLPGSAVERTWWLTRYSWDGSDVVVVYAEEDEPSGVTRTTLSIDELRDVPGTYGDPTRAVQSLPSVNRPKGFEGTLVVRGAEGLATGIYVDGVRIPYLYHLFVGHGIISPEVIEAIDFYPGAISAGFGDVTQGVMDVRTRYQYDKPGVHGSFHADFFEGGLSLNARPSARWTLVAGGTQSWISPIISLGYRIAAGRNFDPDTAVAIRLPYHDYMARAVYDDGAERLSFSVLGAGDAIRIVFPDDPAAPAPPEGLIDRGHLLDNRFVQGVARYDHTTPSLQHSTWLAYTWGSQRNVIEGLGTLTSTAEQTLLQSHSFVARHDLHVSLDPATTLRVGGDVLVQPTAVDFLAGAYTIDEATRTTDLRAWISPFGELAWQKDGWTLTPGLRASLHHLDGRWTAVPEPRLAVKRDLGEVWALTAQGGWFSQQPTPDRYAEGIGTSDEIIRAVQAAIGTVGAYTSGVTLRGTVYGTYMFDVPVRQIETRIEQKPGQIEPEGQLVSRPEYAAQDGFAYGVELMARFRPNNGFSGWLTASLGRSMRIIDDEVVRGDYDLPVSLSAMVSQKFGRGWGASAKFRLTSGYPYTPQTGMYRPDHDAWVGLYGDVNSERFPLFHQLDMRAEKMWVRKRMRITLYLDVFNVYNAHNPIISTYNFDYSVLSRSAYIPFTPSVGLEVAF